jgi:hypothetical protein
VSAPFALLAAALLLACATFVGKALLSLLDPGETRRPFFDALTPVLGLAALLALLDLVVLFVPLRIGAWSVPLVSVLSLAWLVRRKKELRPPIGDTVAGLVGLAMGAVPMLAVRRATVVALTNDDATYYLSAGERLMSFKWHDFPGEGTGVHCLSEQLMHLWNWRVGVPNLVATGATVFRVDATVAIPIVTMLLFAMVAHAGIAIALALGSDHRARARGAVGVAVAISAAPAFLAWQHLLGQLLAFSFFPAALAALAFAIESGDRRHYVLSALLVGAGMNGFADAAIPLIAGGLMVMSLGSAPLGQRVRRGAMVAVASMALFPVTTWRAFWAAYGTVAYRAKIETRGLFLQRGWLPRTPLDDFATLVSVDPWPPWPAPLPPTVASAIEIAATLAALALLVSLVIRARHRRGALVCTGLAAAAVLGVMLGVGNRYLRAKLLLLDAAVVVPAIASTIGRASTRRWEQAAAATWALGGLFACVQLARPEGFHVVDTEQHERFARELSRVPAGSLFVLDGFGAPSDVVHDEHRAFRAAHHAGLVPIQPGLDGGFYKPRCTDPTLTSVPSDGWALQRTTSETLSRGEIVSRFGDFALVHASFATPGAVVGAWAPTHGFLRVEREPDGTVFRWAERSSAGVLHVVTATGCGRLTGEVRSVASDGTFTLTTGERVIALGALTPKWTTLRTELLGAVGPVPITLRADIAAPDESHALALRKVSFEPAPSCATAVAHASEAPREGLLPESLGARREYTFVAAAGVQCAVIAVSVEASNDGGIEVSVKDARRYTAVRPGSNEVRSLPFAIRDVSSVSLRPVGDDPNTIRILDLRLQPWPCAGAS